VCFNGNEKTRNAPYNTGNDNTFYKLFHIVAVSRYVISKRHNNGNFCKFGGLELKTDVEPALLLTFAEDENSDEQHDADTVKKPCKPTVELIRYKRRYKHCRQSDKHGKQLTFYVMVTVSVTVQRVCVTRGKKHCKPGEKQCENSDKKRYVEHGQTFFSE